MEVTINRNRSDASAIVKHLRLCEAQFVPPLGESVDLWAYSTKIAAHAERFEAWYGDSLVGLVAAYANTSSRHHIFVTNVSVAPVMNGKGIAKRLLSDSIDFARNEGFKKMLLKVHTLNNRARTFYRLFKFDESSVDGSEVEMSLDFYT